MTFFQKSSGLFLATAAAALLAGCAAIIPPVVDATNYYLLNVVDYQPVSEAEPEREKVLGLARVRVARYLDNPGLTIRDEGTRVVYSQRHRWAEPVEEGVTRMIVENLGDEPVVGRVMVQPIQRRETALDLHISVLRAEGVRLSDLGSYAVFRADWELRGGIEAEVVARGKVRADQLPWDGVDFGQLADSISLGVVELCHDVARALEEL